MNVSNQLSYTEKILWFSEQEKNRQFPPIPEPKTTSGVEFIMRSRDVLRPLSCPISTPYIRNVSINSPHHRQPRLSDFLSDFLRQQRVRPISCTSINNRRRTRWPLFDTVMIFSFIIAWKYICVFISAYIIIIIASENSKIKAYNVGCVCVFFFRCLFNKREETFSLLMSGRKRGL